MVALIEALDVSKRFAHGLRRESTLALAGLSLAIHAEKPQIIAVVGESGSGKTTLARLLLGLAEPSGGSIRYRGSDLRKLTRGERLAFRRDVQAVFQDPYGVYNPFYRVDHVLTTPVRRFHLAASRAQARELIGETLRAVGGWGRARCPQGRSCLWRPSRSRWSTPRCGRRSSARCAGSPTSAASR